MSDTNMLNQLIPVHLANGSLKYVQNRNFVPQVFPSDMYQHELRMDPDNGYKYFEFDPSTKRGKSLISKYSSRDEEGAYYVMSENGQHLYGDDAIYSEVLHRLHLEYINKNWVTIKY